MPRDEFRQTVKNALAQRAAYFCSNPECRILTVAPHTDPMKIVLTGEACHILAASPGGPDHDPKQTKEERTSIENGVWLCSGCSDRVDRDRARYPASKLQAWRLAQDEWVRTGQLVPTLPEICVASRDGLSLPPDGPARLDTEHFATFREWEITVRNTARVPISGLRVRWQFPEAPIRIVRQDVPPGVSWNLRPDRMELVATIAGGGSVERLGPVPPSSDILMEVSTLGPGEIARWVVWTAKPRFDPQPYPENLMHYGLGEFRYELRGTWPKRDFLVPLNYDAEARRLTSETVEGDISGRVLVTRWSSM